MSNLEWRGIECVDTTKAAELTEYSCSWLRILARRGALPAVKIADRYLYPVDALIAYMTSEKNKGGRPHGT
jgi:hypothetical protein